MSFDSGLRYQRSIDLVDEANLRGELYYVFYEFSNVPVNGTVDFVISTGAKNLFLVGREFTSTSDRLELTAYANPTYTGGAAIPVSPYNTISPVLPPETTGVINPSITSEGALFDRFMFLGEPDNNPSRVAGSLTKNNVLRIIGNNTSFLLRFENKGTVPMDGIVKYLFFEREPDIPLL